MKIATWNISAGRLSKTVNTFDYENEASLDYFIAKIQEVNPDVLCLQETEFHLGQSMAQLLAKKLDYSHVFETRMSDSHISKDSTICIAILSKFDIESSGELKLPYPTFDLFLPNGSPAKHLDKFMQRVTIEGITIVNTFHHPLEFLGHPYTDTLGQEYTKTLCDFYIKNLHAPLIIAGDFSTPDPTTVFALAFTRLNVHDVTPQEPTKPGVDGHLDAIFVDKSWGCLLSGVEPTKNDHYLCWAEIDVS